MNVLKISVYSILCLFVYGVENTAIAENLSLSLLSCSKETNSAQRLQCYDKLSKTVNIIEAEKPLITDAGSQFSTLSQSPKVQSSEQLSPVESFGLPDKAEPKEEVENIKALVTNIDFDPFRNLIVSLDLGQIWQQIDSTRMRLREGDSVYLERAALGSFFLVVEGKSKRMRVKRIK